MAPVSLVRAAPGRVLLVAWMVSASVCSSFAAAEGVAAPEASLLSKVPPTRRCYL